MICVMIPQGTDITTEWSFIAFLLCLVLRFIHHSVYPHPPTPPSSSSLALFFPLSWSQFLSPSLSLSVCLYLSNSFGLFSLIKTVIDQLSAVHQRIPIIPRVVVCYVGVSLRRTARRFHGTKWERERDWCGAVSAPDYDSFWCSPIPGSSGIRIAEDLNEMGNLWSESPVITTVSRNLACEGWKVKAFPKTLRWWR